MERYLLEELGILGDDLLRLELAGFYSENLLRPIEMQKNTEKNASTLL